MNDAKHPGWGKAYVGDQITVYYNSDRCVHVGACVRGLPEVFDTQRRPWILADAAPADRVAEVVRSCPSGALHYELADGEVERGGPTTVTLVKNGPIAMRGELDIVTPTGAITDTRAVLCRCGQSENKPFCDGSHRKVGFEAEGSKRAEEAK